MKNILFFLIIFSSLLVGKDYQCYRYAHYNHVTGKQHIFTKSESNQFPPFNFTLSSNTILVDLPSGNKEKFIYQYIKDGQKIYFSKNNHILRYKIKQGDSIWSWDLNLNGQMQSFVLICK